MGLSYVIRELGIADFPRPFKLEMDNTAAETFLNNNASVSRLKHIDCAECFVKHMRDRSVVEAQRVPTSQNISDIFTKPLAKPIFNKFVSEMMVDGNKYRE